MFEKKYENPKVICWMNVVDYIVIDWLIFFLANPFSNKMMQANTTVMMILFKSIVKLQRLYIFSISIFILHKYILCKKKMKFFSKTNFHKKIYFMLSWKETHKYIQIFFHTRIFGRNCVFIINKPKIYCYYYYGSNDYYWYTIRQKNLSSSSSSMENREKFSSSYWNDDGNGNNDNGNSNSILNEFYSLRLKWLFCPEKRKR